MPFPLFLAARIGHLVRFELPKGFINVRQQTEMVSQSACAGTSNLYRRRRADDASQDAIQRRGSRAGQNHTKFYARPQAGVSHVCTAHVASFPFIRARSLEMKCLGVSARSLDPRENGALLFARNPSKFRPDSSGKIPFKAAQ
jgi:hypothetical protein